MCHYSRKETKLQGTFLYQTQLSREDSIGVQWIGLLLVTPISHIRITGLNLGSSSSPASCWCIWQANKWYPKCVGPCQPQGRPWRVPGSWLAPDKGCCGHSGSVELSVDIQNKHEKKKSSRNMQMPQQVKCFQVKIQCLYFQALFTGKKMPLLSY